MEEHVGRKRRKEVRQAINMKRELSNSMLVMIGVLICGLVACGTYMIFIVRGLLSDDNMLSEVLPIAVIFILVMFLGSKTYRWTGLREEYKRHCQKYNISKEDMQAFRKEDEA